MTDVEKNYLEIIRIVNIFNKTTSSYVEHVPLRDLDEFMSDFYGAVNFDLVAKISDSDIMDKPSAQIPLSFGEKRIDSATKNCKEESDEETGLHKTCGDS